MRAGKARCHSGFTLIELLVTLAVMVIIATIAVPGLQSLITNNRVAGDYNEILTGLHYARSEAVKRREPVKAVITAGGSGGWQLTISVVDGPDLLVREAKDERISTGSLSVTFNSLGRRASCSTADCEVNVASKAIEVNPMGRIGKPSESAGGEAS